MATRSDIIRFAAGIALSAFLLFQVQPLIAAFILPWFGGTANVWTTCLLFFQTALVGGYAYAHWITQASPRVQGIVHIALLGLTLLVLPITPADSWKPTGDEVPALRILLLLSATVGAPYLLLSTTGPLLQRWFSLHAPGTSPYRLYALSNAASLLGLLAFPFVVQPLWDRTTQAAIWSVAYAVFALVTGWSAFELVRKAPAHENPHPDPPPRGEGIRWRELLMWLLLAAGGTIVRLSNTNTLTQDMAAVPFLWVVPLALYLISFIIAFEKPHWYRRKIFIPLIFVFAIPVTLPFEMLFYEVTPYLVQAVSLMALTFVGCMSLHGELVRRTPPAQHLTLFYLMISIGGALGGFMVAIVAPLVFPHFFELTLATALAISLPVYCIFQELPRPMSRRQIVGWSAATVAFWAVVLGLAAGPLVGVIEAEEVDRNFFGVLRVQTEEADEGEKFRTMRHGYVVHGLQFLEDPWRMEPTTYYNREAGIGVAFELLRELREDPLRVGVVGLGTGTVAVYGEEGDTFRFYEINPAVIRMAREHFTLLRDSKAEIEVVLGDARLSLEREHAAEIEPFDLLVVDAFAGDSIPIHLITREAFQLYESVLTENGVIVFHISNQHLTLEPVALAGFDEIGFGAAVIEWTDRGGLAEASTWVVASRWEPLIDHETIHERLTDPPDERILWTDSYSSLLRVLD